MKKHNDGFTLVELIVVILVASIVTMAGTTALLTGMRMSKATREAGSRQNNARVVMYVLESVVSGEEVDLESGAKLDSDPWEIRNTDGKKLCSYTDSGIYIGDNPEPLITELKDARAEMEENNLLKLSITTEDETYTSTVYCRITTEETTAESTPASGASIYSRQTLSAADITPNFFGSRNVEARQAFLSVLMAQEGSTGADVTTGEYFSEWYIGSYEDNPEWNAATPWCACFVSWALEQCRDKLNEVPRFAHVDKFMESFDTAHWRTLTPHPGDVVFFDWVEDSVSYPQHVGVVVTVEDGCVYTIEGNTDGKVAARAYDVEDPCILGYGVLDWK